MTHCEECGRPLGWRGMSWSEHTDEWHQTLRRHLYRVIARQMGRQVWRKATGE